MCVKDRKVFYSLCQPKKKDKMSTPAMTTLLKKDNSFLGIGTLRPKLNLRYLQGVDPMVDSLLHVSCHVVLYKYDRTYSGWMDTRIQGCLFITKSWTGSIKMLLLNRTNRHDTASITIDLKDARGKLLVEYNVPEVGQIMVREPSGEIYNLWFLRQVDFDDVKAIMVTQQVS